MKRERNSRPAKSGKADSKSSKGRGRFEGCLKATDGSFKQLAN